MNIIFAGTPEFSAFCLEALLASEHTVQVVYTQPDRVAGRGQHLSLSPVKNLAASHRISVQQPQSLHDQREVLASYQADIMIVIAYGLIVPATILTLFPFGCINVHASLLPRWRGAAPIQRAILAGDQQTGISIMQMDKGLDTGDVLEQAVCPIEATDTSQILHNRLARLGTDTLLAILPKIANRTVQSKPQNDSEHCYADKIHKLEARIDWNNQTVQQIERKIRAFNPWPVAYTCSSRIVIRIWRAEILCIEQHGMIPGTILATSKKGIDVAAQNGIVRLLDIQLPGGRVLPVSAILNANSTLFSPGSNFE